ncbi:hypothetical protein FQN57_002794 [Myotisia sp. PD_48]|nr:hypothetical protein FQN57_002794 [Myotisia sp. PD_48]
MHLRISQRPPLRIYSRIVLEPRQYLGAIIGGTIAITGTLVGIVALFIYFQRRREKRLHRVPTHFTLLRDQPTPASPQGYPTHIPTILRPGSHVDRNKTDVPGMPPKSLSLKVKLSSLPTSTEPPLASHPYYAYPLISIESNEKNRTLSSAIPPASGHKKIQRVKAKPNLRLEMKPYPPPMLRYEITPAIPEEPWYSHKAKFQLNNHRSKPLLFRVALVD